MYTKRNIAVFGLLAIAMTLSGCYMNRTAIRTTDGRNYKIYADDELLCESSTDCRIPQYGTPQSMELKAVMGNTVVGKTTIKREINGASIAWGFFTYFITLYVYQAYPSYVYIPIDYNNDVVSKTVREGSGTDWNASPYDSKGSSWDAPPNKMPINEYDAPADEY